MKTRKKTLCKYFIALIVVKFCLFSPLIKAQSVLGIYLSSTDFTSNNLWFKKGVNKKCKIKMHNLSFKLPIKITCGDSILQLSKDSVYGYKDAENSSYRFFNKKTYTIMNPGETILLYKLISVVKTKYEEPTYSYYFSKDASSLVLPLNLNNIENTFGSNKMFIDFLEVHFKNDNELLEYDSNHKIYKINRLLELSK